MDMAELNQFIVEAKACCYAGNGAGAASSRHGSHDLSHERDGWRYLDSYFGGTDFAGQEIVWFDRTPVWAMNYYGTVLVPELIDSERAGAVIKAALSELYATEKRFLGGFLFSHIHGDYHDESHGDVLRFTGREHIVVSGRQAYALHYHGGRITP